MECFQHAYIPHINPNICISSPEDMRIENNIKENKSLGSIRKVNKINGRKSNEGYRMPMSPS